MESSKPHIVILSSPGMGHVIPCLELAKCLVSHHDVEVSFFVPSTESSFHQTQLLQKSNSNTKDLHVINLPPVIISNMLPIDVNIPTRLTLIVQKSLPAIRSAILRLPRPPTVFISDLFSTYGFEIADDLKMEKYMFSTVSASVFASIAYIPKLVQQVDAESIEIPGCKPVRIKDLGGRLMHRNPETFQCMSGHVRNFVGAAGILINTFKDLERQTLKGLGDDNIRREIPIPPVYPIGPIIKSDTTQSVEKLDCLTWLDNQPCGSVVFIAFGSGGFLSAVQITELAWGLELSKQRFLWVVRPPKELTNDDYLASAGVNNLSDYLPDGFLTRTHGIGLVVSDWVPQVEVLSHESIGAFMSHCGWNSTLESMVHGVPMITWQLYAEQHWNALMLTEDIGVAVRLANPTETGVIRRDRIEKAVRLVMEEEKEKSLRNKAKELKYSATRTMTKGGSSYDTLSKLVKTWEVRAAVKENSLNNRTLKLLSGSCYLPHPDKEETGGEDAHFICVDQQAVGVADGVGGWADVGVNAGLFARELISHSVNAIQDEPKGSVDPARVLEKAHSCTKAKGSSTACIIALTDQGLNAINLGDSGFVVVRDGHTVFQSPVQQHGFNFTYQLESGNTGDLPSSGQVFAIPVAPGDVIVAGTDGLFDNLYNNEITAVVVHAVRAGLEPQVTAQKIAALARQRALDKNRQTPFATAAQDAGFRYNGGKLDDITVVVSYVSSSSSNNA
ncbi:Udp-glycosyltransferase 72e3 [Thalictrum thalictroides]|uniref:Udp-glycosyltransferase 72e3 n=1 Tax=Thalictrum thalictroides TaxID=46969 RepID=A0A7J6W9Z1_THATH|nr:Udp-glycosyltransferase 72e3 [Thalictrum thalictroides]